MKETLLCLVAGLMLVTSGCASQPFITETPVLVAPQRTNTVAIPVTNYVPVTVFTTNTVGVVETNTTTMAQVQTNFVVSILPAIYYTNLSLTPMDTNIVSAASGAATLAGVPFAGLGGQVLLLLAGLGIGFINHLRMKKALNQKQTALDTAMTVGQTLVENFEDIRKTALQIPQYAAIDDKVMGAIKTAQQIAGVKEIVSALVDQHTGDTKN